MTDGLPYILTLALIVFLSAVSLPGKDRGNNAKTAIIVIVLSLIAGLRATSVGSDTATYSRMFYWIADSSTLKQAFDVSTINAPVYVAYAYLLGKMGFSHQMLLVVNALITNIGIGIFIKRTCDKPATAFLIYFCLAMFFESMNGMRQYVAIALAVNAYLDFYERGITSVRGWVLIALAVGIHSTAMAMMPAVTIVIIMRKMPMARKVLRIIFLVAALVGLIMGPLAKLFIQIFPNYGMYDGTNNIDLFSDAYGGRIRILYAVMLVACLFGYVAICNGDGIRDRYDYVIFLLLPICYFAGVLGIVYGKSFLINRLLWFYMVAYVPFIPAVVAKYHGGMNLLMKMGFGTTIGVWMIMQLIENQDAALPYVLGISLLR
ncbi:MAG: EpsG family protein [Olsenella sp.]|jgi:hypothetical protein